jgi:hypothetical protein
MVSEYRQQVFALLETSEFDRYLDNILGGERPRQPIPEIVKPKPACRIGKRGIKNQSQRKKQVCLPDLVFAKHDRMLTELHVQQLEVSEISRSLSG